MKTQTLEKALVKALTLLSGLALITVTQSGCSLIVDFDLRDAGPDTGPTCEQDSECDDENPCTADSCDEGFCVNEDEPEGTDCEGTLFCRDDETCDGDGNCDPLSGTEHACPGGDSVCLETECDEDEDECLENPAEEGTDCDGELFCATGTTCDGDGNCDPDSGTPVDCDDDNTCTEDACDEEEEGCVNAAVDDGTSCEDTFFCREGELCMAGECDVGTGRAYDCNDAIHCTDDSCSEENENCTHLPQHESCTEEGFGWCDPEDPDANDEGCTAGRPCTDGDDCDDDNNCNGIETCSEEGRCVGGTPLDCDDGFACTVDSCDSEFDNGDGTTGACVNTASNSECDDFIGCTLNTCDPDAASADADGCVYPTDDGYCEDDQFCDGVETCAPDTAGSDATTGCLAGTPPTCDDGATCTVDTCDPEAAGGTGACDFAPDETECDNDLFCDGLEVCNPDDDGADETTGCVPGTAPDCDDEDPCTIDSCDNVLGECVNTPPECEGTGDGCCPASCTVADSGATDYDLDCCLATCGAADGVCNPCCTVTGTDAATDDPDCCVAGGCDDSDDCTADTCTADRVCENTALGCLFEADGCCPAGGCIVDDTGASDYDEDCCLATCETTGDGTCNPCCSATDTDSNYDIDCCETGGCDDSDDCTADTCTADRVCENTALGCLSAADGCCPAGGCTVDDDSAPDYDEDCCLDTCETTGDGTCNPCCSATDTDDNYDVDCT